MNISVTRAYYYFEYYHAYIFIKLLFITTLYLNRTNPGGDTILQDGPETEAGVQ